jgi:hypothetical protein
LPQRNAAELPTVFVVKGLAIGNTFATRQKVDKGSVQNSDPFLHLAILSRIHAM